MNKREINPTGASEILRAIYSGTNAFFFHFAADSKMSKQSAYPFTKRTISIKKNFCKKLSSPTMEYYLLPLELLFPENLGSEAGWNFWYFS